MIKFIYRIKNKIKLFTKIFLLKKYTIVDRWFYNNGDQTFRVNYDLNSNSVVFDVGGYVGDWTEIIFKKYDAIIYIFEPVNEYYQIIKKKFENVIDKIKTYNYGLGAITADMLIEKSLDSSSIYSTGNGKNKEMIKIKSISEFIHENSINQIDLIKINIEGGEYELLNSLIENKMQKICRNIQIQFHDHLPNAIKLRNEIRHQLSKTHHLTYDFEFVWENWELNS